MAVGKATFETLIPSRFTTFTFPNPTATTTGKLLRVAVLDSPNPPLSSSRVAALLVPENREDDWIFSTEAGHLQLLLNSPGISRLVLIGSLPIPRDSLPGPYRKLSCNNPKFRDELEQRLLPLLLALSPKSSFETGIPEIPFLGYEDNITGIMTVAIRTGSCVGEMVIEDVEIECMSDTCSKPEFRRRLRFKKMPNLVQTQIRILTDTDIDTDPGTKTLDMGVLVHPYLGPMVASLSLIESRIEKRVGLGLRPKALCLGVGGGALISFLETYLGFEVMGVEVDDEVLWVARMYFGLVENEFVRVRVGDAIECLEEFEDNDTKFDVVFVDLDSNDVSNGVSAPPLEFVQKQILVASKVVLCEFGILVLNVIPSSTLVYETLVCEFREVFEELYEIDVGNGENFVLIAAASPIKTASSDCETSFTKKLKKVISGRYMASIRKL